MPAHPHLGYVNPVTGHDFPDPGVFYDHRTQAWYAFATNGNGKHIQCSYTKDFCSWTHHDQDCLPGPLPPWQSGQPVSIRKDVVAQLRVKKASIDTIAFGTCSDYVRKNYLWAPEVIDAPQGRGGYLMYLSCQDAVHYKQCIGIAYSDHDPRGPYRWITDRPLISRGETGGALDPQPFEDPVSGKRYLVYKSDLDRLYTKKNQLWISELSPDGLSLVGEMHPLQAPSEDYHANLIEAPYLFYHAPSGAYILFFSSGTFTKGNYTTSYVISRKGIFGPYEKPAKIFLQTDRLRNIMGPGGACVVRGVENEHFIVFHALEREDGDRRMCIQRIGFQNDGTPYLTSKPNCGKRLRLGAEQEDDMQHYGNQPSQPAPGHQEGHNQPKGGSKMSGFLRKVKDKLDS